MTTHRVVIDEPRGATDEYFWTCACGKEGGPCASYNRALESVMAHERRVTPRPDDATEDR